MSGGRQRNTGFPRVGTVAHKLRVAERDNWVCGICGTRVDYKLSVYDSIWAAVVDHIMPKWAGGSHEDSNLQIAHYECNRLKGKAVKWTA